MKIIFVLLLLLLTFFQSQNAFALRVCCQTDVNSYIWTSLNECDDLEGTITTDYTKCPPNWDWDDAGEANKKIDKEIQLPVPDRDHRPGGQPLDENRRWE